MIRLEEVVVVEGKYDKIRLENLIDGLIFETDGFRIFKDKEKLGLLRALSQKRGLIVLTDSDVAGFRIRAYLSSAIDPAHIRHVYIPERFGKERRKDTPSKAGTLGVEGIADEDLLEAFRKAGITGKEPRRIKDPITKGDLYLWGLSGGKKSRERRLSFLKALDLPPYLSANRLVEVLNRLYTKKEIVEKWHYLLEEKEEGK